MNKKISTLLAGAALLSVVAVNAQEPSISTGATQSVTSSIPKLDEMTQVKKLNEGVNTELYQLKISKSGTDYVLSMDSDGALSFVNASTLEASDMANTLWCVTVSTQAEGQAPKYDFENRATGMLLDIAAGDVKNEDQKYTPTVGGNVSGWAFSRSYKALEADKALFSYIDAENILGFTEENGEVKVAKVKATDYDRDSNTYKGASGDEKKYFTEFTLMSPAEIFLNAKQLNTIFGTYEKEDHGLKLSFAKDVAGTDIANPFNAQSFYTETAETVTSDKGVKAPYLHVRQKDKESYLRVDTAYTNEQGVPFLAYKWVSDWYDWDNAKNEKGTDYKTAAAYLAKSELKDQYKFLFKYTPKNDNLEIYIHTVTYKDINDDSKDNYWYNTEDKGYNNRVSLQDLIKNEIRILTVDKEHQNTTITLGYKSCGAVTPTRTSLADNVYFIRNAEGQYLASPIHKNGTIEWVTVNEKQDVNHMPAFQWIALKNNTADKNNVSAVTFRNREYPDHSYSTVQLNKKADKDYYYVSKECSSSKTGDASISTNDQLTITAVDAAYQSDKYLGYKKISKDDLMVNKFTFNYYHPYSSKMFIAQSENDSTLSVLENVDAFVLDTIELDKDKSADEAYGYGYASLSKDEKKRLPNLVQLYRTVYKVKKGDKDWAINKEDKFNVSSYWKDDKNNDVDNNGNEIASSFFFKENNCIDGTHYYAILSTEVEENGTHKIKDDNKAGVSDYDPNATLKSQVLTETRTSAFAIAPDNSPLYRRFNNVALGESDTDAADSLIFVEKYRKEYLMDEANPSFLDKDVDYVGIWSKDKAKGKLAFNVDTAWLHRGSGEVKPQYLISVAREDQGAIETIPCTDEKGHHFYTDANGKVHPTDDASLCDHAQKGRAGFAYGKYLVNFSDSVKTHKYKTPYMDVDGGYTRVGFVKAIHAGDSLFVLTQGFENVKPENLDTAEIIKKYKDLKINEQFIVNLQGDRHKNVTWSFRYVNPDKAGSVDEEGVANEFLFESNIYDKDNKPVSGSTKDGQVTPTYGGIGKATIAPEYAAWLKMQNGCLVLTRGDSKFDKMSTGSDGALIFNAYQKEDADKMVTDNETINTVEGVSITTDNGTVTIQGAAGKSVVISNILGKVVAETVLSSDNATIAVPAGIVAVAVDGEAAVKVVVK